MHGWVYTFPSLFLGQPLSVCFLICKTGKIPALTSQGQCKDSGSVCCASSGTRLTSTPPSEVAAGRSTGPGAEQMLSTHQLLPLFLLKVNASGKIIVLPSKVNTSECEGESETPRGPPLQDHGHCLKTVTSPIYDLLWNPPPTHFTNEETETQRG